MVLGVFLYELTDLVFMLEHSCLIGFHDCLLKLLAISSEHAMHENVLITEQQVAIQVEVGAAKGSRWGIEVFRVF